MKKYLDSLSNYAPWISDEDKHFAQINKIHTNIYKHKYLTDQGFYCMNAWESQSNKASGLG